ncbi:hypothetical protein V8G54_006707 [Vigna mungo]|uniref:Uncharacterized protein n=1 Tax=Vigna mungo TaxID=3915 RepID=A0AAQ3P0H6_VIGMU
MVFDGVVGASVEEASDGGPLVPEPGVRLHDHFVFLRRKRPALDLWRQLIAPPQPARFPRSTRNGFAYEGPVSGPVSLNQPPQGFVFFGTPWPFYPIHYFLRRRHGVNNFSGQRRLAEREEGNIYIYI